MVYFALYGPVTFTCLFLLSFFVVVKMTGVMSRDNKLLMYTEYGLMMLASVSVAWDIAQRPISTAGDTATYWQYYEGLLAHIPSPVGTFEPGFTLLARILSAVDLPVTALFFLAPVMLILAYHQLAVSIFGRFSAITVVSVICLIAFPFFLSLSANVIRQGIATALILWAVSSIVAHQQKRSYVIAILSVLCHRSSVIILPFIVFGQRIAKLSLTTIVIAWFGVTLASYAGVFQKLSQYLFGLLASRGLSVDYSAVSVIDYVTGFRWDFWVFSSVSIVFLVLYELLGGKRDSDSIIFKIGCYFSIIHIALFSVAYNDRFGIYAWILYPLESLFLMRMCTNRVLGYLADYENSDGPRGEKWKPL